MVTWLTDRPRLLEGYGTSGFPTSVSEAQAYFTNSMELAHAFARSEAISALREAGRLDPSCAACIWGEAWASGPTINYPISEIEAIRLTMLIRKAQSVTSGAPEKEGERTHPCALPDKRDRQLLAARLD